MAAAARALSTGSGERGVDDDPSWPGTVREEMPGAAGGAGAAGAAPGAAPGGGARPSGGALPSIIIDLEAEDTDSSATMPMSREAVKAALDKVRARDAAAPPPAPGSAAAAAAAAPSPSPSPSPSSAGFMGGAAAPAAGSSSALQAATAAPAPAAAAPPGSVAPEAPGATAAASPPAVGLRAAAPARRTPAQGTVPAERSSDRAPRSVRAAAALQAAGTIIEGRPQPVRADTGAGAAPRRRSGAMPAATGAGARAVAGAGTGAAAGAGTAGAGERAAPPLVSTEVDTVRMKSLGETPAATPQTGGAANPEDAKQKRTTLPGIGIDKKGFVEGDADTPPGGVPVRPTER
jgi:hypothetical protein